MFLFRCSVAPEAGDAGVPPQRYHLHQGLPGQRTDFIRISGQPDIRIFGPLLITAYQISGQGCQKTNFSIAKTEKIPSEAILKLSPDTDLPHIRSGGIQSTVVMVVISGIQPYASIKGRNGPTMYNQCFAMFSQTVGLPFWLPLLYTRVYQ